MNSYLSYGIILLLIAAIAWMRMIRMKRMDGVYRRKPDREFPYQWEKILEDRVPFFQGLSGSDKRRFTDKAHIFLVNFEMVGVETEVTDLDRVLVAAGATIPVFRLEKWHYKNLTSVSIFPDKFPIPETDKLARGLTGWGHMEGEVWFSRKAIYEGFHIDDDAKNVVIHEFIHLMDMQDGIANGLIEELMTVEDRDDWKTIAREAAKKIQTQGSTIREYAIANPVEFIAATSEYYFECPDQLRSEHPKLYRALDKIFNPKVSRFSYR